MQQPYMQLISTNRTAERPNGLTGKAVNLVPISIITGTRTKRGTK